MKCSLKAIILVLLVKIVLPTFSMHVPTVYRFYTVTKTYVIILLTLTITVFKMKCDSLNGDQNKEY